MAALPSAHQAATVAIHPLRCRTPCATWPPTWQRRYFRIALVIRVVSSSFEGFIKPPRRVTTPLQRAVAYYLVNTQIARRPRPAIRRRNRANENRPNLAGILC